ncbi:hypothetical protein ACFWHR_00660 [Leucobacter sp. NPDC058333]|uniref:hypothetical protein n=1 Tax=Leucobacter sp. NPDC058333 TaxID=3346450 RepID=UPI00365E672C
MLKSPTAAALLCVAAFALAACATPSTSGAAPVYADADTISAAGDSVSFDYEPVTSTKELAAMADVVTTGTVVGVQDGPKYGRFDDEMNDISSVVIEVRVDKTVQGEVAGSSVYLSMLSPDATTLDDWNRAYPTGVGVVAYATRSPEGAQGATGEIDTEKWQAGRPEGAALHVPLVQGFAVQVDEKHLLWPLTGVTREATLRDALPDGPAVGTQLPGEEPTNPAEREGSR